MIVDNIVKVLEVVMVDVVVISYLILLSNVFCLDVVG